MHLDTANHFDDGNFYKLTIILLGNGVVDKKPMTRRLIRDHPQKRSLDMNSFGLRSFDSSWDGLYLAICGCGINGPVSCLA
jgi:hypothetical protein